MLEAPEWLRSLMDNVANCVEAHGLPGSMGYRWRTEDDDEFWE